MTYEEYARIRDEKNLSDAQVAKKAGIGRSTFSDWKSGRSKPKDEKMRKIAEALDMNYFELIDYSEHLSPTSPTRKILDYVIKDKKFDEYVLEATPESELLAECIEKVKKIPDHTLKTVKSYLDFLLSQSQADEPDKKT